MSLAKDHPIEIVKRHKVKHLDGEGSLIDLRKLLQFSHTLLDDALRASTVLDNDGSSFFKSAHLCFKCALDHLIDHFVPNEKSGHMLPGQSQIALGTIRLQYETAITASFAFENKQDWIDTYSQTTKELHEYYNVTNEIISETPFADAYAEHLERWSPDQYPQENLPESRNKRLPSLPDQIARCHPSIRNALAACYLDYQFISHFCHFRPLRITDNHALIEMNLSDKERANYTQNLHFPMLATYASSIAIFCFTPAIYGNKRDLASKPIIDLLLSQTTFWKTYGSITPITRLMYENIGEPVKYFIQ